MASYNDFALDKATVAACPIQIDYVRLPEGYDASEKTTVRKSLTVIATCFFWACLQYNNVPRRRRRV